MPEISDTFATLYRIRHFEDPDQEPCRRLFREGLLGGQIPDSDTGLDIDDIRGAYCADPLNNFWVAQVDPAAEDAQRGGGLPLECQPGQIIGMIGVQHHDEHVGEIRRLRVHPSHRRRGIGSRLLETAVRFCRETGCLKVQLDTFVAREEAVRLFERFGFRHGRTRQVSNRDLLYFYLDLYAGQSRA